MKAGEIMSTSVFTVKRDTSVEEIAHIMVEKNISGVPVVDDENRVVGIITQRDLLYKDVEPRYPALVQILGGTIFLQGVSRYNKELKKLTATRAEELMTRNVVTVDENTEVERAARIMVEKEINRIPVVRDGKLVGIISRADVVKYIAKILE